MSVVIIGGHDRMVCQYKKMCKNFNCKIKVFTQMGGNFSNQIGSPDLMILFTNTVSHKMAKAAISEAAKCNAEVVRCHTSSQAALNQILSKYFSDSNRKGSYNTLHGTRNIPMDKLYQCLGT